MASDRLSELDVQVCGLGACTPVGRSAWASAAAVRAGIAGFTQHPFMVDSVGRPMHVAACDWLAEEPDTVARMLACLLAAVQEALEPLFAGDARRPPEQPVLIVALPAERPGLAEDLGEHIERGIGETFPRLFSRTLLIRRGHAAGMIAVAGALQGLQAHEDTPVLVAGTDSWLDPDTLEWLEDTGQLHGAGERNNAWGFVPGEGAGALLLLRGAAAQRRSLPPLARVIGCGLGVEQRLIRSGEVCLGKGLTDAVRAALAGLPPNARVSDVYGDMNGDPYRADEYGFTVTRTRERFDAASDFHAPADCWGDVGAASAPLSLVLAVIAQLKAYAKGRISLAWASSDGGERGAVLLAACGP